MNETELLAEARKRYPPGTRYIPAHMQSSDNIVCIVGDLANFRLQGADILESTGNRSKNGHNYCEVLYMLNRGGTWARIVEKAEVTEPYNIFNHD